MSTWQLNGRKRHEQEGHSRSRVDDRQPIIFFCNGPQCGQSPIAIKSLLEAGYPVEMIRYYRGGMHDWLTLGLPAAPVGQSETADPGTDATDTAD